MKKTWIKPAGTVPGLYASLINQPHILCAGSTGSGKSVLINGLIHSILYFAPCEKQLVLLDPKRVELSQYKNLPHTLQYANTPETALQALQRLEMEMERRFQAMEKAGVKMYCGSDIYCIIDEWIDLRSTCGKEIEKPLIRLAAMARAARIHIVLCTQRPTSDIITGTIKANFTCKLALRCNSKQESRNVIDCTGAEMLPNYGYALYRMPAEKLPVQVAIPFYSDFQLANMVTHWEKQNARYSPLQRLTKWIH